MLTIDELEKRLAELKAIPVAGNEVMSADARDKEMRGVRKKLRTLRAGGEVKTTTRGNNRLGRARAGMNDDESVPLKKTGDDKADKAAQRKARREAKKKSGTKSINTFGIPDGRVRYVPDQVFDQLVEYDLTDYRDTDVLERQSGYAFSLAQSVMIEEAGTALIKKFMARWGHRPIWFTKVTRQSDSDPENTRYDLVILGPINNGDLIDKAYKKPQRL